MRRNAPLIRDLDVGVLLDTFLAVAVSTILVVRSYLAATGYPQIGSSGSGIHIAHALFGGLLLMVALVVALALLSRAKRWGVAVCGGIGFGLFIDELGKFITQDVNYFFRPTAALIYIIFVAMYLSFRALGRHAGFGRTELLANAVALMGEAAHRPLRVSEWRRVDDLLRRSDPENPLVGPLQAAAAAVEVVPEPEPGRLRRWLLRARDAYASAAESSWFVIVVALVAAALAGVTCLHVLGFSYGLWDLFPEPGHTGLTQVVPTVSAGLTAILVAVGIWQLPRSRLSAYRSFDHALLVNLFITEIFLFAQEEFWAALGFVVTLALLFTVRLGMRVERDQKRSEDARVPPSLRPTAQGAGRLRYGSRRSG